MLYFDELTDHANLLAHIDGFVQGLGLTSADIDDGKIIGVVRGMGFEFPAIGGQAAASPFKSAANFFCYFIAERPILSPFTSTALDNNILNIPNHQNVMVAYDVAVTCLHNATIHRADGDVVLKNRIMLSQHSHTDLIHACRDVSPNTHFHIMSVFFEQLAYKFNPDASYPLVI